MKEIFIVENGSYSKISELFKKMQIKKYMLVCGKSFDSLYIKDILSEMNVPYVRFSNFTPNPRYEEVVEGVNLFNCEGCDCIVAVGGGSAIDVAKCIKLYAKMNPDELFLTQEYEDTGIPLIAIPTTAGTGSESTRFAVIYHNGIKQSVSHESIIPDYAFLDPALLENLPVYQKKCTVFDALCQGIESWWSVNSTDESKMYSKKAVELISGNMHSYINDNSKDAAKSIMTASNYAGMAINITQTTAAHAMSYKLTSLFKIPHGHAVGLCLPMVWEFMLENENKCIDPRGYEYLKSIFKEISQALYGNEPKEAVLSFINMMKEYKMDNPVSENRDSDLSQLVESVNITRLSNNPVSPDKSDLKDMYERILK